MNMYCNFTLEEALKRELTMAQLDAVRMSLEGMLDWFKDEERKE